MAAENWRLRLYITASWLQFLLLITVATYLSLVPDPGDSLAQVSDTFLHLLCWFVLSASLRLPWVRRKHFWLAASGLFVYSIVIECFQYFLPPRTFSWDDVAANGIGILAAYLAIQLTKPFIEEKIIKRIIGDDQ